MSGNGNGHPFGIVPRTNALPIVGQPFTLKTWLLQLLLTCNCSSRPEPLLVVGQVGAESVPCPQCGRRLVLQAIGADRTGQLQFSVGITALPSKAPTGDSHHGG